MDKNGKLFGKINIIDLLVLVIAVAVVAAVGLKMTGHLGAKRAETGTNIAYTVRVEGVDKEVYDNIQKYIDQAAAQQKPGDQLMSNGELLSAYVTGVTAQPHKSNAELTTTEGAFIIPMMEDTVDLTFTIEGSVSNNLKSEMGSQEVRVGKTHIVKTTHFELNNGVVLSCEWENGTAADNAA